MQITAKSGLGRPTVPIWDGSCDRLGPDLTIGAIGVAIDVAIGVAIGNTSLTKAYDRTFAIGRFVIGLRSAKKP